MMKKIVALLLALILCLSFAACGNNDTQSNDTQEESEAQNESTQQTETVIENYVYAMNSTVEGETSLAITEKTSLEAKAETKDGMVVDYWMLNGAAQENSAGESFSFTAEATTFVEPVFRPEKKVTAINAEMRFVDQNQKAGGDKFTEFVFEKEYTNTVTGEQVTDGTIAVEVKAVVPAGKMVDYWLINGVQYYLGTGVSSFVVVGLDEATTYEAVFKDIPVTYYKLTCVRCNWNGKASASIIAGSTITITCNNGISGGFYVNGVKVTGDYVTSVTITINSDTIVEFYATIN